MHEIKRAIIMAAGTGSRMHPVTLRTPKPLVKVNGQAMIDSVIGALHENGIDQIYIVVGYLKEQFAFLPEKYPGVTLIENPWYDSCNNISSLYMAREYIGEAIILDGDQVILDPRILKREFARSGYNAVWTEDETREWVLEVENDIVTGCSRTGGSHGWQLFSVSWWTREDGQRLKAHLELEFEEKKNRQIYWDDVALFCHPEAYQLGISPMEAGAVLEIDSLEELIRADPSYENEKWKEE